MNTGQRVIFASVLNRPLLTFFFIFLRSSVSSFRTIIGRGNEVVVVVEVEAEDGGHDRGERERNAIQSSNWLWRVAFLDFISQPFLTIWIAVFSQRIRVSSISMETPIDPSIPLSGYRKLGLKSQFLRGNLCSKNGKMARVHRSQSGCDMLIQAFISQPALMSVASR